MRIKPTLSLLHRTLFTSRAFTSSLAQEFNMAWRSSGSTNAELINNLYKNNLITTEKVRDAMSKVDRAQYCPNKASAYEDSPQPIGHSATISAPHMHASALEYLFPSTQGGKGAPAGYPPQNRPLRVLDVGSGSGYLTHCIAELVGDEGRVVGIEHIPELCDLGKSNMAKSEEGKQLLESAMVEFVVGDGRLGWKEGEESGAGKPWDAIHVGASAASIHPELIEQLAKPGRMFIPVDDEDGAGQHIWVVDKDGEGNVKKKKLYAVGYVPLVDPGKRL